MAIGKTTIYDIAQLSGASPSTVSAVLNGTWARRRISSATVEAITKIATDNGYSTNMQARGLRQAKSGLIGMIIPIHDNRFFSSLSQNFDKLARERGLCPVIASTLRDHDEEQRVVETLISYAVDAIFIVGASDPDQLGAICTSAHIKHIFIDLPGKNAPSVVTDNFGGAYQLTKKILTDMQPFIQGEKPKPYFFGGSLGDFATAKRAKGFEQAVLECGGEVGDTQFVQCGYAPRSAADAIATLCAVLGQLPSGLFVNSIGAFEGFMNYFVKVPASTIGASVIGCFDYDPFASFLQFPVHMVRQDSLSLVTRAYELLDEGNTLEMVYEVKPQLIEPRTIAQDGLTSIG